jgi:hypothetical protein
VGIIDPKGLGGVPGEPHDPIDDVDPLELPEEDQVTYELGGWSLNMRAAAAEALADASIPHSWVGDDVVVHVRHEDVVDQLLEEVEQQGRAAGEVFEEGPEAEDGVPPASAEGTELEFDLDEWTDEDRALVSERLDTADVPHRWESETVLVVAARDEALVEAVLDEIEQEVEAEDEGRLGDAESPLSALFVAADDLASRPNARDAVLRLNEVFEQAESAAVPFGLAQEAWEGLLDEVSDLLDLALDSDDEDEVREGAKTLRERLKPLV